VSAANRAREVPRMAKPIMSDPSTSRLPNEQLHARRDPTLVRSRPGSLAVGGGKSRMKCSRE